MLPSISIPCNSPFPLSPLQNNSINTTVRTTEWEAEFTRRRSEAEVLLTFSVAIEERIDVRESEFVVFGKERVVLGILEALLKPVIAKPWGGMDQVPPLIGEVLHSPICHGNEQRSVWVQPRSPRNYVHCRSASLSNTRWERKRDGVLFPISELTIRIRMKWDTESPWMKLSINTGHLQKGTRTWK